MSLLSCNRTWINGFKLWLGRAGTPCEDGTLRGQSPRKRPSRQRLQDSKSPGVPHVAKARCALPPVDEKQFLSAFLQGTVYFPTCLMSLINVSVSQSRDVVAMQASHSGCWARRSRTDLVPSPYSFFFPGWLGAFECQDPRSREFCLILFCFPLHLSSALSSKISICSSCFDVDFTNENFFGNSYDRKKYVN